MSIHLRSASARNESYQRLLVSDQPRQIPKKIHQMWLNPNFDDNNDPRAEYLSDRFAGSFKKHNPTYEYKLWKNRDIEELFRKHPNKLGKYRYFYYNELNVPIERCDFARWCSLLEGGFYFDMDVTCLRSLDTLIENRQMVFCKDLDNLEIFNQYIMREDPNQPKVFNGCFALSPQHPIIFEMLDYIMYNYNPQNTVFANTGPFAVGNFMAKNGLYDVKQNPEIYVDSCLLLPYDGFGGVRPECSSCSTPPYVEVIFTEGLTWQLSQSFLYSTVAIRRSHILLLFLCLVMIFGFLFAYIWALQSYKTCELKVTNCELKHQLNDPVAMSNMTTKRLRSPSSTSSIFGTNNTAVT